MCSAIETLAPGFLVAAPMLQDPNFDRTVVLLCVHNQEGAMGLVINRPAPLSMQEIIGQLGMECRSELSQTAMVGGPVALNNGLVLYEVPDDAGGREDELHVAQGLRLSPNRELLVAIGRGEGPERYHMFLGHAGWGPHQLETEIAQGAWIPVPFDAELVFKTPFERRWDEALRSLGLHPAQFLSSRPQA